MSPDKVSVLGETPSITVEDFHAPQDAAESSFYGIEDSVGTALAIGEQTLGMYLSDRCYASGTMRVFTHKVHLEVMILRARLNVSKEVRL